jgi:hypothetical protein
MKDFHEFSRQADASLAHLITHSCIVALASILFTAFLFARFNGTWFNPVDWAPCLLVGFLLNGHWRHRSACFVWICGLVWFAFVSRFVPMSLSSWLACMTQYGAKLYFPTQAGALNISKNSCFILGTNPTLNSISYSVGAAFGLLIRANRLIWPTSSF